MLNGLPLFLEYIQQHKYVFSNNDSVVQDFLSLLNESLAEPTFNQSILSNFRNKHNQIGDLSNMIQPLLQPIWTDMSINERCFIIECIESGGWKENTWSGDVPDFTDTSLQPRIDFRYVQEIALHSILIPKGISEWNSKSMQLNEVGIIYEKISDEYGDRQKSILGGALLDIRGVNSPTPSANRWFIPYSNAEEIIISYWRALLKHAVKLIENYGDKSKWYRWFYVLCSYIFSQPGGKKAIETEWESIVRYIALRIKLKGIIMHLNKEEILKYFGQEIPVINYNDEPNRDGILINASSVDFGKYILVNHPDIEYLNGKVRIIN